MRTHIFTDAEKKKAVSKRAAQIILHLVAVAGKVKSLNSLLRQKNESPRLAGTAFLKVLAQLADGKPGVDMRVAKPNQIR